MLRRKKKAPPVYRIILYNFYVDIIHKYKNDNVFGFFFPRKIVHKKKYIPTTACSTGWWRAAGIISKWKSKWRSESTPPMVFYRWPDIFLLCNRTRITITTIKKPNRKKKILFTIQTGRIKTKCAFSAGLANFTKRTRISHVPDVVSRKRNQMPIEEITVLITRHGTGTREALGTASVRR